jgi:proteasome lid subunit RPN8/RPN11
MLIHLPRTIYNQMLIYCTQSLPHEACGVLLGMHEQGMIEINQFVPISNQAIDPSIGFVADPKEWTSLLYGCFKGNTHILGLVHSHPTAPAIPSFHDLQTLWYTIPTYWIISTLNMNNPITRAYCFQGDGTCYDADWIITD